MMLHHGQLVPEFEDELFSHLEMNELHSVTTLRTDYPLMHCIPGKWNPQPHLFENLKTQCKLLLK